MSHPPFRFEGLGLSGETDRLAGHAHRSLSVSPALGLLVHHLPKLLLRVFLGLNSAPGAFGTSASHLGSPVGNSY